VVALSKIISFRKFKLWFLSPLSCPRDKLSLKVTFIYSKKRRIGTETCSKDSQCPTFGMGKSTMHEKFGFVPPRKSSS